MLLVVAVLTDPPDADQQAIPAVTPRHGDLDAVLESAYQAWSADK